MTWPTRSVWWHRTFSFFFITDLVCMQSSSTRMCLLCGRWYGWPPGFPHSTSSSSWPWLWSPYTVRSSWTTTWTSLTSSSSSMVTRALKTSSQFCRLVVASALKLRSELSRHKLLAVVVLVKVRSAELLTARLFLPFYYSKYPSSSLWLLPSVTRDNKDWTFDFVYGKNAFAVFLNKQEVLWLLVFRGELLLPYNRKPIKALPLLKEVHQ